MIDYNYVLKLVAEVYRVTPEDIKGPSRSGSINQARKMVCLVLKDEPFDRVAKLINRSGTVVNRNKHHMLGAIDIYPYLQQRYTNIMSQIQTDMTITLTLSQLQSLYDAIEYYLSEPAVNIADELIHLHLDDIAERIRKRIKNKKPNLNLDDKQAKAFTLWHMWNLGKVNNYSQHGATVMIDMINQIKPIQNRQLNT